MNPLDGLWLALLALVIGWLLAKPEPGESARLRRPYCSPCERPSHWQTLDEHKAQMDRIAHLPVPQSPTPKPRPKIHSFKVRYHAEGEMRDLNVDGYDLNQVLEIARRCGVEPDMVEWVEQLGEAWEIEEGWKAYGAWAAKAGLPRRKASG